MQDVFRLRGSYASPPGGKPFDRHYILFAVSRRLARRCPLAGPSPSHDIPRPNESSIDFSCRRSHRIRLLQQHEIPKWSAPSACFGALFASILCRTELHAWTLAFRYPFCKHVIIRQFRSFRTLSDSCSELERRKKRDNRHARKPDVVFAFPCAIGALVRDLFSSQTSLSTIPQIAFFLRT